MRAARLSPSSLSLRSRLTLTFALVTMSATLAVSTTTFLLAKQYLVDQRERAAIRQTFLNARLVRDLLQTGDQEPQAILDDTVGDVGTLALLRFDEQWYASGVAADPSDLPADLLDALDNGAVAHQRITRAGKPRVVIGVPLSAVNAEYLEIIPLDVLQRTIRTLVISLLIGSIGTTLAGTLVGVYVSQRVLRPVKKMSAVAAGITEGDLRARLDALTGVIFALEVPYRADLARRALLPSLVAAGSAYVTYVAIVGTTPLLSTGGSAPFNLTDLGGGLALGLACGVLARIGAWAIAHAKHLPLPPIASVVMAASAIAALAPLAHWWFETPLHLGPGYEAIHWAAAPDRTLVVLVGLFAIRALSTWLCISGGGVGGLFIPLVTQGAIVGSIFQHVAPASNAQLFPTVGIAAFLGAGYRTPLAGVAFVAEATGQPGFLVPALLAAAAAQIIMGRWSFSLFQRNERLPDVGPLARLPIGEIMSPNPDTIDASLNLDDVVTTMLAQNRRWAPVVDGTAYFGLLAVTDVVSIPRSEWPNITARDIARTDLLPAASEDPVSTVAMRLRASDSGAVAVTADGRVIGVVTLRDLTNIEVLLDRLNDDAAPFRNSRPSP